MTSRCALVFLFAVATPACDGPSPSGPSDVSTILAGTHFGLCGARYCLTSLAITPGRMVYTETSWSPDVPPRRREMDLSREDWERLAAAVDRPAMEALPRFVDCPGCADGGVESLEVVGGGWRKEIQFAYGRRMPELQPLLDHVRRLRSDRFDVPFPVDPADAAR